MRRKRRRLRSLITLGFLAGLFVGLVIIQGTPVHNSKNGTKPPAVKPSVGVITLGGSVARGWRDTGWQNWKKGWFGGYLVRGFKQFSSENDAVYKITDHTIVGANSSQMSTLYKGRYQKWLLQDKPRIVVLSWGLLNDALPKTPLPVFRAHLLHEITLGLKAHAVVFVVAPPVTEASFTIYQKPFRLYLQSELDLVQSLHNPNVYAFDLYDQMLKYISAHHISFSTLIANSWHPNAKGHEIAGAILANDLKSEFGRSVVHWKNKP